MAKQPDSRRRSARHPAKQPASEWLQAVGRHDVRDRPGELCQVTAEVRVPGVAVNEIDAFDGRSHREVDGHRLERRRFRLRIGQRRPWLVGRHARLVSRRPPAMNRQLGVSAQLARQVFDVDAGPAVDLGRVFTSQQCDLVLDHPEALSVNQDLPVKP